jgi:hypothetical protein
MVTHALVYSVFRVVCEGYTDRLGRTGHRNWKTVCIGLHVSNVHVLVSTLLLQILLGLFS